MMLLPINTAPKCLNYVYTLNVNGVIQKNTRQNSLIVFPDPKGNTKRSSKLGDDLYDLRLRLCQIKKTNQKIII